MEKALQRVLMVLAVGIVASVCGQGPTWPQPPKWPQKAEMARYLTHYANWGIVSAISPEFGHQPFGTLQSFADGTLGNSSGTPYFYIARISDTAKNIQYNNTVSFSMSQAMSDYCYRNHLDPEEPTCSRLTLTGNVLKVVGVEREFAKVGLFSRHPAMKGWPTTHGWDFYKLKLTGVFLLDFYGGCTHVPLSDYYKEKPGLAAQKSVMAENSILRKH